MVSRRFFLACYTWYTVLLVVIVCDDYKGFDDTVLFKINWPGADTIQLDDDRDFVEVTTHLKEKYRCSIPNDKLISDQKELNYNGPTPFELVSTFFSSSTCSYRIESYWTYEVCHGNYIKQYHEEREGIRTQEYYLGKWQKEKTIEIFEKIKENEPTKKSDKYKTIRIDGVNLPYLEVEMADGTFCELNGEHRVTTVQYVCYPHGKNEVYSLKEVSTCSYEAVILTQALCIHPSFNPKETNDNSISCVPLSNAPSKPRSLLMEEAENMRQILATYKTYQRQKVSIIRLNPKDGTIKSEVLNENFLAKLSEDSTATTETKHAEVPVDVEPTAAKVPPKPTGFSQVLNFLEGKHCLTGGGGWWKYEFCYGRYVRQFHIDKSGETSLLLGSFDEQLHKDWLKENPQKRPQKSSPYISYFYQGGSKCDETGEPRQTEVQLKCVEDATSKSKVALFLREPKTCNYILGVESHFVCEIMHAVDEDGLINIDAFKEVKDDTVFTTETTLKDSADEL